LLQEEFPSLTFVELAGYRIRYGKNRAFTVLRLVFSIPKILIRIKLERAWLRRFAAVERPDLVISDNRYGLALPDLYCVFVTHQLMIRTPFGGMADRLLQAMNYRLIRRFARCWAPDVGEGGGVAGELSHPVRMPAVPVRYIGLLSRFGSVAGEGPKVEFAMDVEGSDGPGFGSTAGVEGSDGSRVLALLSGPEPQRTLLEDLLLGQAATCRGGMILVRGLPAGAGKRVDAGVRKRVDAGVRKRGAEGVTIYDHLPAGQLEELIRRAQYVVARPGYSTIMDLIRLEKKAVLIPTPGQTEQEYLGRRLATIGWAICREQRGFSLEEALAALESGGLQEGFQEGEGQMLRDEVREVLSVLAERHSQGAEKEQF
jgi:UDP-N-acetylglucosamine transferase subunit ALG13